MMIRLRMRGAVSTPGEVNPGGFCRATLGSACVALVAFFAYEWILECSFTGTDVFALIESSQINSLQDLIRIFSGPLMQGTDFTSVARFYRPLATLSYSLDFLLWGLDPFGFQLTNLLLHVFVCIAVFFVMLRLAGGDAVFASASAVLFAVHPVLVECVPAIDRRHDLLGAFFLAVSLWCCLVAASESTSSRRSRAYLVASVGAYLCALGGKEIAIILPGVVWGYALLMRDTGSFWARVKAGARLSAPYVVVSFLYLLWRIHVLGDVGGYANADHEPRNLLWYVVNTVHCYVQDLVYPEDFGGVMSAEYGLIPTAVLLGAAIAYFLVYFVGRGTSDRERKTWDFGRLTLFLLLWLALPLAVFLLTLTFSHRSMYVAVIPLAGLVAGTALESVRALRAHLASWQSAETRAAVSCWVAVIGAAVALCLSLAAYSPLLNVYAQWKESARISTMFLDRLAAVVQELPKNCSIHVHGLPEGVSELNEKVPHAKEVTYLRDYAIKSWLNLQFPKNAIRIFVHKRTWPQAVAESLGLSMLEIGHNSFHVFVDVYRPRNTLAQAHRVHITRPLRAKSFR